MDYEATLRFITLIEGYPALWKKDDKDFVNRELRKRLLTNVAERMGMVDDDVRRKMKNLKDKMREVCNRLPKTASGQPAFESGRSSVRWPFYKSLLFMRDQFMSRDTNGGILVEVEDIKAEVNAEEEEEEEGDIMEDPGHYNIEPKIETRIGFEGEGRGIDSDPDLPMSFALINHTSDTRDDTCTSISTTTTTTASTSSRHTTNTVNSNNANRNQHSSHLHRLLSMSAPSQHPLASPSTMNETNTNRGSIRAIRRRCVTNSGTTTARFRSTPKRKIHHAARITARGRGRNSDANHDMEKHPMDITMGDEEPNPSPVPIPIPIPPPPPQDEWNAFSESICHDLRKITNPYLVVSVKNDINRLVADSVIKQLNMNSHSHSHSHSQSHSQTQLLLQSPQLEPLDDSHNHTHINTLDGSGDDGAVTADSVSHS